MVRQLLDFLEQLCGQRVTLGGLGMVAGAG
jgi:hypothetical protein